MDGVLRMESSIGLVGIHMDQVGGSRDCLEYSGGTIYLALKAVVLMQYLRTLGVMIYVIVLLSSWDH